MTIPACMEHFYTDNTVQSAPERPTKQEQKSCDLQHTDINYIWDSCDSASDKETEEENVDNEMDSLANYERFENMSMVASDIIPVPSSETRPTNGKMKFSLRRFINYVGPGFLVAMAYLDPGNLEADLQSATSRDFPGAGYRYLWLLILGHLLGFFYQYVAIRLGCSTGLDLAEMCRLEYTRFISNILWVMIELAIIGTELQAVIGSAIGFHLLFNIPIWVGILLTIIDSFTILLSQAFGIRILEMICGTFILVMAICFGVDFFQLEVDVPSFFKGMFIPYILPGKIMDALGLLGCIIMPHNLFLQSRLALSRSMNHNKYYEIKEDIMYSTLEVGLALLGSLLINIFVMATFASPAVTIPAEGLYLYTAHSVLRPVLGSTAVAIWAIGLLSAGQNATISDTFAGQIVLDGFLHIKMRRTYRVLLTRAITISPLLFLVLISRNTVDLVTQWVNVFQATVLPFTLIPLLKFGASEKALGKMKLSKHEKYFSWAMSFILVCINLIAAFAYVLSNYNSAKAIVMLSLFVIIYLYMLIYLFKKPTTGHFCRFKDDLT